MYKVDCDNTALFNGGILFFKNANWNDIGNLMVK